MRNQSDVPRKRKKVGGEDAAVGCFLVAWLVYALLFVAFWGLVAWAIWRLVMANT